MPLSSFRLQDIVDQVRRRGDITPILAAPGSDILARSMADTVMDSIIKGGPEGQPFNFKWNRVYLTPFFTNSFQQDYASANTNIGWLEHCRVVNANSTATVKETYPLEVAKDLEIVFQNYGRLGKISWEYNDHLVYGKWGQTQLASISGLLNPGPNVVYTDPTSAGTFQGNPITQIQDPNGNLLVLTQYGTCGGTTPSFPSANAAAGTTVNDGSVIWTVVDPKAQGFRVYPLPGQSGVLWQVYPVAQKKPVIFANLQQTLEPIPDEFYNTFKAGFVAQCYLNSSDPRVRGKFKDEWAVWQKALLNEVRAGNRENDDVRFYPESSIMDDQYGVYVGPANPYGGWGR
jgi:hypothetical protein